MFKNLDVKKNINRLKHIADQNLGRVEKKDAIPEELRSYNDRADDVYNSYRGVSKALLKICESLSTDKKEKYAENRLKLACEESYNYLANGKNNNGTADVSALEEIFAKLALIEGNLADNRIQYERNVNDCIIEQLNEILKKSYPNIQKIRSNLKKAQQELDICENKLSTTNKQLLANSSSQANEKLAPLESDRNEALNNVEMFRNDLGAELYAFSADETRQCKILSDLVDLQKAYHERCLDDIKNNFKDIEISYKNARVFQTFARPLELQKNDDGSFKVAYVIERCCQLIRKHNGLIEDGILRVAPSAARLKRFKAALDIRNESDFDDDNFDVHTVAGALKIFLREIPNCLLCNNKYDKWTEVVSVANGEDRKQAMKKMLESLPEVNKVNLRYLFHFLVDVVKEQSKNRMSAHNVAIVIGPNLLRTDADGGASGDLIASQVSSTITECLISYYDFFFEGTTFSTQKLYRPTTNPPPPPTPHNSSTVKDIHRDIYSTTCMLSSLGVDPKNYVNQAHSVLDKTTRPATNPNDVTLIETTKKKLAPPPPPAQSSNRKVLDRQTSNEDMAKKTLSTPSPQGSLKKQSSPMVDRKLSPGNDEIITKKPSPPQRRPTLNTVKVKQKGGAAAIDCGEQNDNDDNTDSLRKTKPPIPDRPSCIKTTATTPPVSKPIESSLTNDNILQPNNNNSSSNSDNILPTTTNDNKNVHSIATTLENTHL